MDPQTWIARHKVALWTIFDTEGKVCGLAQRERRNIAFKLGELTSNVRSTNKINKRIAQLLGRGKLGLKSMTMARYPVFKAGQSEILPPDNILSPTGYHHALQMNNISNEIKAKLKRLCPYIGSDIPNSVRQKAKQMWLGPYNPDECAGWHWDDGSGIYQCELEL